MTKQAWLVDPKDDDRRICSLNLGIENDRLVAREQWDALDSERLWELTPFRTDRGKRLYLRKGKYAQSEHRLFFYKASPPGQISRSEANELGNTNPDLDFLRRLIEATSFAQLELSATIKPKRLRRLPDLVFRLTSDCPLSRAEKVDFLSLEIRDHQTDKLGQDRHLRYRAVKAYHVVVLTKLKSGLSQAPSIAVSGKSAARHPLPDRFVNNIRHLVWSKNAPTWALESKMDLATVVHRILVGHAVYTDLGVSSKRAKGWFWVDPQRREADKLTRFQQLKVDIREQESELVVATKKVKEAEDSCEKTAGKLEKLKQQTNVVKHLEDWIMDEQASWSQVPKITEPSDPVQELLDDPLWNPKFLGWWHRFRRRSKDIVRVKGLHQQAEDHLETLSEELDSEDSEVQKQLQSARDHQTEIQQILEQKGREKEALLDGLPGS